MLTGMARRLHSAGFALHWLHPKDKRPIGDDWADKPVASIEKLERTYRDGNNIGVRLGRWSKIGNGYLHVIDLDVRRIELAEEALAKLRSLFPTVDFQKLPIVMSGSGRGSSHFHLLSKTPFSTKKLAHSEGFAMVPDAKKGRDVKKWDWEISLLGTGSQVVLPPSIHPDTGKPYKWLRAWDLEAIELGLATPLPDSVMEAATGAPRPAADDPIGSLRSLPLGLSLDQAKAILADLPKDDYCDDRDGWLRVGMALHHEFDGDADSFGIWRDFSKHSEKYDEKDLKRVWRSFKGKAVPLRMATLQQAAREARLEAEFENLDDTKSDISDDEITPIEDDDPIGDVKPRKADMNLKRETVNADLGKKPSRLDRMNLKHAIARVAGNTVIMDFQPDGSVVYGRVRDLHSFYANDRVATERSSEPISETWLRHPKRRDYPNGIVFSPNVDVPGAYNHWQGFAVEPNPNASCKLFLNHLRRVICSDNKEYYDYLIGWLAHLIQRPEEKPGVAITFKGDKGAGKDTVFDYVGKLFPHHHVKIANREQLVGKFNAHQERCLVLHVEEGFWAGTKSDHGPLQNLITSTKVTIEPKGVNSFSVKSVLRLFISSNEEWIVPATAGERRYFVLLVDDAYTLEGRHADKRTEYFEALYKEMNGDGPAALLAYLQGYDLKDFKVRNPPQTEALGEQKIQGLKNVDKWWYEVLLSGELGFGGVTDVDDAGPAWGDERVTVNVNDMIEAYVQWMAKRKFDGDVLDSRAFGKRMKRMIPDLEKHRPGGRGNQRYVYDIPELKKARRFFNKAMTSNFEWD